MKIRTSVALCLALTVVATGIARPAAAQAPASQPLVPVRAGWCTKAVTSATSPWAIATKMGWFAKAGIAVTVLPTGGSSDCARLVATKDYTLALSGIEPVPILRAQGVKIRVFHNAYPNYIYGIAVPVASPVKTIADLKGQVIGVNSMGSNGVIVARALASEAGLDPDKDIKIVVAGEGAQAAAQLKAGRVQGYSSFDTQYATVGIAGVAMRELPAPKMAKWPSGVLYALEETIATKRAVVVAAAQGFAKGQIFALANPEAAVRILWEVFPQTRPTGKSEAQALADEVLVLKARAKGWQLEATGSTKWGYSNPEYFQAYLDWLQATGTLKEKALATEVATNELVDEVNRFDVAEVVREAKAWTAK